MGGSFHGDVLLGIHRWGSAGGDVSWGRCDGVRVCVKCDGVRVCVKCEGVCEV